MKFILVILVLLSLNCQAETRLDDMRKLLAESQTELIGNFTQVETSGLVTDFDIFGEIVLTGRIKYLTVDGESLTMTVPRDLWLKVNDKFYSLTQISYTKTTGIDLPMQLRSIK